MKLYIKNLSREAMSLVLEYFPGIELTDDNPDVSVDLYEYRSVKEMIKDIRHYCPKYLQEYAEDLEEVINEKRH